MPIVQRLTVSLICLSLIHFLVTDRALGQEAQGDEPALVTADDITYDETLNIVIARGNVELAQDERLLLADTVTYDQGSGIVIATGNVVLVEPDGDVMFAEYVELTDDFAQGFADTVSILFIDDSRMIANQGVRESEDITKLERAVYSPCDLCPEDPTRAPLWQLRAVEVTHDRANRDVIYRDAFLDMFGIPVLYTPYFSHPDPTVDRRSGLLTPVFGSTPGLGPFVRSSYYFDIAPEQDFTLDVGLTREAGGLLGGEYRRRFANGVAVVEGSVNVSDRDEGSGVTRNDQLRWHVFGNTRFDIDEHWRVGADIQRSSDDTYLELFEISGEDVLESRAFAEGFYGLSYLAANVFAFQDLREGSIEQPLVTPLMEGDYVGEPGAVLGGQVRATAEVLNLVRTEDVDEADRQLDNEGVSTRRLSLSADWQRAFFTDVGLVADIQADLATYFYWSDNVPEAGDPSRLRDGVTDAVFFPRATATARYPLVRQSGDYQQLVEPIASITAAPVVDDVDDIPNNDSLDVEFDEINLFSDNRFPGIDRLDGGVRLTYGLRTGIFDPYGGQATVFLGQSYRFEDITVFPEGSGLRDRLSDFVGQVTIAPADYFSLDYRFRFDQKDLRARRQEVSMTAGVPALRVSNTYTFVDEVAGTGTTDDREEILSRISSRITDFWQVAGSFRYDLAENEARNAFFGLTYSDECFTFSGAIRRDFTTNRDVDDGISVFATLAFRNLGVIPLGGEQ